MPVPAVAKRLAALTLVFALLTLSRWSICFLFLMGAAASSRGEGDGAGEAGAGDEQREAADGRTIKFADEELDDNADRKQARDHLCGMGGVD